MNHVLSSEPVYIHLIVYSLGGFSIFKDNCLLSFSKLAFVDLSPEITFTQSSDYKRPILIRGLVLQVAK